MRTSLGSSFSLRTLDYKGLGRRTVPPTPGQLPTSGSGDIHPGPPGGLELVTGSTCHAWEQLIPWPVEDGWPGTGPRQAGPAWALSGGPASWELAPPTPPARAGGQSPTREDRKESEGHPLGALAGCRHSGPSAGPRGLGDMLAIL